MNTETLTLIEGTKQKTCETKDELASKLKQMIKDLLNEVGLVTPDCHLVFNVVFAKVENDGFNQSLIEQLKTFVSNELSPQPLPIGLLMVRDTDLLLLDTFTRSEASSKVDA